LVSARLIRKEDETAVKEYALLIVASICLHNEAVDQDPAIGGIYVLE
jgi:hypothetical protein